MNDTLKTMIKEEFMRQLNEKKRYMKTRELVESIVRERLMKLMSEEKKKSTKISQVQQALNDPSINKSGLARKIKGLSDNDDTRRSEISKIARGDWKPDNDIQNDILHTIASDTE